MADRLWPRCYSHRTLIQDQKVGTDLGQAQDRLEEGEPRNPSQKGVGASVEDHFAGTEQRGAVTSLQPTREVPVVVVPSQMAAVQPLAPLHSHSLFQFAERPKQT